jgi:hypothetical protein
MDAKGILGELQKQYPGFNENYGIRTEDETYTPSISELQQSYGEDWGKYATQTDGNWSGTPQVNKATDPLLAALRPWAISMDVNGPSGTQTIRALDTTPQQIKDLARQAGLNIEYWDKGQAARWGESMQDARSGSWANAIPEYIAKGAGALITALAGKGIGIGVLGPLLGTTAAATTAAGATGAGLTTGLMTGAQAVGGGASPLEGLLKGLSTGVTAGLSAGLLPSGAGGAGAMDSVVNGGLGELTQPGYTELMLGGGGFGVQETFTSQVGKLMNQGYDLDQIIKMNSSEVFGDVPFGNPAPTTQPITPQPSTTPQQSSSIYDKLKETGTNFVKNQALSYGKNALTKSLMGNQETAYNRAYEQPTAQQPVQQTSAPFEQLSQQSTAYAPNIGDVTAASSRGNYNKESILRSLLHAAGSYASNRGTNRLPKVYNG